MKDVKNNQGFYRCVGQKRQAKKSAPLPISEKEELETDTKKAELPN